MTKQNQLRLKTQTLNYYIQIGHFEADFNHQGMQSEVKYTMEAEKSHKGGGKIYIYIYVKTQCSWV